MMGELKEYGLMRYSKKTGNVDKMLSGLGCGMIELWALQNTTKTKNSVVFELKTGLIRSIYRGDENGFPKIEHAIEDRGLFIDAEALEAFKD